MVQKIITNHELIKLNEFVSTINLHLCNQFSNYSISKSSQKSPLNQVFLGKHKNLSPLKCFELFIALKTLSLQLQKEIFWLPETQSIAARKTSSSAVGRTSLLCGIYHRTTCYETSIVSCSRSASPLVLLRRPRVPVYHQRPLTAAQIWSLGKHQNCGRKKIHP